MTSLAPSIVQAPKSGGIAFWLISVWAMILGMVLLGGITRLTGSGLSMVDWHPLMGAFPPVDEDQWNNVFDLYKQSPQFLKVNQWMDLEAFKKIFFWEYLHRMVGRLIGVVVLLPCIYFWIRGKLSKPLLLKTMLAIFLGGLQGLLGWFMVKSGLVDDPKVSHFRLAAHLVLAMLVGQWILWMLLDLHYCKRPPTPVSRRLRITIWSFVLLLLLQITYGAFVAGLRAGHMAMTFPDMNGYFAPHHFFTSGNLWQDMVHTPLAIHFIHRTLGLIVLLVGGLLFWRIRRTEGAGSSGLCGASAITATLLFIQVGFGIWTLVSFVSIPIAVAHQGIGFLLLGSSFCMLHRSRTSQPT
jgi:cytochrome c oxidase assembly protein subunit 15